MRRGEYFGVGRVWGDDGGDMEGETGLDGRAWDSVGDWGFGESAWDSVCDWVVEKRW